ncbi:MAG: UDP-3-O-(3-hydroxymyristoyl)glucosamine N-acyltransferase [Bacteroidales bacterium]|jgi:UDP-3-O-[3-hydroxymyristoyl] glucosamine N-acyltransferase|nr:UDP-3-O-(3-hydroxymyristoyl)glucosamine N-acyltransferase [Bacteroidales bacterium]
MEFSAKQISLLLNGEIIGNEDVRVNTLCKIEDGKEGGLSFLANDKYEHFIYDCNSSIVIVNKSFSPNKALKPTIIKVDNAYESFAKLLDIYNDYFLNKTGVASLSFISKTAKVDEDIYVGEFAFIGEGVKIGKHVKVYPNCYIGDNVIIGDNVTLFAGVRIYHNCIIGNNCILHSGVVIGTDGFGFAPLEDGSFKKIAQIGNVILEDDVEVGANSTIDRSTMGSTIIEKGVKIDNLVQIAHNVVVGKNTAIASQTGVAGSSKIGHNCFIGGQVGIAGHLTIGNRVKIGGQAGILSNIKDDSTIMGTPALNAKDFMRSYSIFRKLPQMQKQIDELTKKLESLSPPSGI